MVVDEDEPQRPNVIGVLGVDVLIGVREHVGAGRPVGREDTLLLQHQVVRLVRAGKDVHFADAGFEVLHEPLVDDLGRLADELDLDAGILRDKRVPHGIGRALRVVGGPPDDLPVPLGLGVELLFVGRRARPRRRVHGPPEPRGGRQAEAGPQQGAPGQGWIQVSRGCLIEWRASVFRHRDPS